jgi:hypothetical protein
MTLDPMSSRKHFVWGFVVFTALMTLGCVFAVWLVYRLVGPE